MIVQILIETVALFFLFWKSESNTKSVVQIA